MHRYSRSAHPASRPRHPVAPSARRSTVAGFLRSRVRFTILALSSAFAFLAEIRRMVSSCRTGVDHIQDSRVGKPNRCPTIFPVVLASVVGFNPPGVVKQARHPQKETPCFSGFVPLYRRPIQVPLCSYCSVFCSYIKSYRLMPGELSRSIFCALACSCWRTGSRPSSFSHCWRYFPSSAVCRSPAAL